MSTSSTAPLDADLGMPQPSAAKDFFFSAALEKIPTRDAVVALRRFGQGPALMLVHGFPLHGFTWRHLLPQLSRHYTCYVPDLAGLGETEWRERTDFGFHGQARRLHEVADALGLQSYGLLAQDTGATIARCLALRDPRVNKLVMFNTEIPGHRPPWIQEYQLLMRLPGSKLAFRALLESRRFLRSPMAFGGCFDNLGLIHGDFHEQFVQPLLNLHSLQGIARYLIEADWDVVDRFAREHARLQFPVLLIWGREDPTFPVGRARVMEEQFPDCRGLVEIPNAKLLVHEEQPEAVLASLLPFLQGG